MIRYVKYQSKSQLEGAKDKWFLRVKAGETLDLKAIAKHMAAHNTAFSPGVIYGVLTDMVSCIQVQLLDGKKVKIADLAIFSLGVHCKGADRPENATPANITGFRFNAQGTGELRPMTVAQKAKLKELDEYSV